MRIREREEEVVVYVNIQYNINEDTFQQCNYSTNT